MRFQFRALKGIQGHKSFYQVNLPFESLGRLVTINPEVQRKLNMRRVRQIFEYICMNPATFYFPSLTLAAPGNLDWNERSQTLSWEDTTKLSAVDGMHRVKGILMVMESEMGDLFAHHHIGATIYPHMPTERQADLFSTVNGEQKPVTKAVRELRNFRSRANLITRDVILHLDLGDRVEWWTSSLRNKKDRWFAFSWLLEANRWLLQSLTRTDDQNAVRIVASFWDAVFSILQPYLGAPTSFVVSSAPVFVALGQVGRHIITSDDCDERIKGLAALDWSRHNGSFENVLLSGGVWRHGYSSNGVSTDAQNILMKALGIGCADRAI